jgi:hypothetical protein
MTHTLSNNCTAVITEGSYTHAGFDYSVRAEILNGQGQVIETVFCDEVEAALLLGAQNQG